MLFASNAKAQIDILTKESAESIRRQEERTKDQQQRLQTKVDLLESTTNSKSDVEFSTETPCFFIQKIIVKNSNDSKFGFLNKEVAPFLNRCIGVMGVRKIAAALDSKLIEKGYITTRVSLEKQNLSDGQLTFFLHEGRIADIVMTNTVAGMIEKDMAWGTWKNAFPINKGDILNIRAIEQGVEQMKRLPSQMIETKIEPGEEADTSLVRIERQTGRFQDRLRGGLTFDNSGSQSLGRGQLSSYVMFDNLAGINDLLTLSSNINSSRPNAHHRSYGVSTAYNIPWGYNNLNFSANTNRFAQYVKGTTTRFLSSGKSNAIEAQWNYLLWRTASTKVTFNAGVSNRSAESFLDDVELIVQRRRTNTVNVGVFYTQFIENGSIDLNVGYREGTGWGNAQADYINTEMNGLTIRPRIISINGTINRSFDFAKRKFYFSTNVRGQYTPDTTLSIDQISIGGRGSVRGFDGDSVLLAESGLILRNELSSGLSPFSGIESNVFVAIDYGLVSGTSAQYLVGKSLAGLAVGVKGKWKECFFDFSISRPLNQPSKFQSKQLNPYLSVTYSL